MTIGNETKTKKEKLAFIIAVATVIVVVSGCVGLKYGVHLHKKTESAREIADF